MIHFQPRAFYKDILQVCKNAESQRWAGLVKKRYNGWTTLELNPAKTSHSSVIGEINGL
jgi:hypothetical protein